MKNTVWRGRILLIALVFVFAMPVISAKLILNNEWYESGVTNQGLLIDPPTNFQALGLDNPLEKKSWQLGYVVPKVCDAFCEKQLYLLGQSHTALGKEKERVEPVAMITSNSDADAVRALSYQKISVNDEFVAHVSSFEYVIVDPLGQIVMRYPKAQKEDDLVSQSKGLLADFRKLLKLSRVG
ncbi:hypothetical protein [Vibrio sp. 10N.261.55.A7]|uniref:hypothetical protein n=1 Tax=Vibrio sp. 10N.261.55.A7 TaxID=1880851 RepID=UPI000C829365|nr:hypothetical protein [Vibrio sp. 10N.261.55.A7]PMJ98706.1 hypothetical protein BCU12_04150 [Vibrio sp. 10N.261.55.A7]